MDIGCSGDDNDFHQKNKQNDIIYHFKSPIVFNNNILFFSRIRPAKMEHLKYQMA